MSDSDGPTAAHWKNILLQQFSTWALLPQGLLYPSHLAATTLTRACVFRLAHSVNVLASNNRQQNETESCKAHSKERDCGKKRLDSRHAIARHGLMSSSSPKAWLYPCVQPKQTQIIVFKYNLLSKKVVIV